VEASCELDGDGFGTPGGGASAEQPVAIVPPKQAAQGADTRNSCFSKEIMRLWIVASLRSRQLR
jgi:hypothetical protein